MSMYFSFQNLPSPNPNKMETNNFTEIPKADQVQCTSGSEMGKKIHLKIKFLFQNIYRWMTTYYQMSS